MILKFRKSITLVDGNSCRACGIRSLRAELSILKAKSIFNLREHSKSSMCRRGHSISSKLLKTFHWKTISLYILLIQMN